MPLEQDLKDSEAGEKHQTEIFLLLSKPPVSFKRAFDEYPSFFFSWADQFSSQLSYKKLLWSYNLVLKLSIDKISRTQLFSERTWTTCNLGNPQVTYHYLQDINYFAFINLSFIEFSWNFQSHMHNEGEATLSCFKFFSSCTEKTTTILKLKTSDSDKLDFT